MAYVQNDDDEVSVDQTGVVRTIRHSDSPVAAVSLTAAGAQNLTPKDLADEYLQQTASLFNFPETKNLAPTDLVSTKLSFQEEKIGLDTITVLYKQMSNKIPVWDSGFSVRIKKFPLEVIGAQNEFDYGVTIDQYPTSGYLPENLDNKKLQALLGLSDPNLPMINKKSLMIYQYKRSKRVKEGSGGWPDSTTSSMPLPEISLEMVEDKYYVCTDVLFTQPWNEHNALNWRAFIEPLTGSVLYLRALTSGAAQGCVYLKDPVTKTGSKISSVSPAPLLDAERENINILRLGVPTAGVQSLSGKYVKLTNAGQPTASSPFSFAYQVKTGEFAAVNAFHHCDALFQLVEDFGFNLATYFDGTRFPVPVEHYGMGGQVNAQALGNSLGNGSGGFDFGYANPGGPVGIATDPRVVWHEFGHALLWDHVNSPNFGFAHSPGDSLGAIYFDPETKCSGLDRFETFPFMQLSAGLHRRHDRDVSLGWCWEGGTFDDTQYGSEQILSTTMFRIYQACGGDGDSVSIKTSASRYVIFLILKAIDQLTMRTKRPQVLVDALMDADKTTREFQGFPGGLLHKVIRWSFEKQGLYQAPAATARIQPGAPPKVDVYIDDGRNGEYMPYSANGGESTDIWNRHNSDGLPGNEAPSIGVPNYLYVKVNNRGTSPASGVIVSGFQSVNPSGVWPQDWNPTTTAPINWATPIAVGTPAIIGPFEWTPTQAQCGVLFTVDAAGDRCNSYTATVAVSTEMLTLLDNNIAKRTF